MRIKVYGKTRSISLQTNHPMVKKSKKPIKWQIIDGAIGDAELLVSIMKELEKLIKKDFPPQQLLFG